VVLALVTDLQVVFELPDIEQLAAALVFTAYPEAVRGSIGACAGGGARYTWDGDVARLLTKQVAHCGRPTGL
jgi:hypothetical protein